jgi:2-polyprenyl-3-methyl-5-hydroxy-6-metoxy-1,4-benzoquinol methylase
MDEKEINVELLKFYNSYIGTVNALSVFENIKTSHLEEGKKLIPHLSKGNIVFAGCNIGYHVWSMQQLGYDASGFDISKDAITKAVCSNCVCCPVKETPYKDKQFSNIILFDVLEHIPMEYLDDSLKECERICSTNLIARIPYIEGNPFANRGIGAMIDADRIFEHTIDAPPDWWKDKIKLFFTEENGWKYSTFNWSDDILADGRRSLGVVLQFTKE